MARNRTFTGGKKSVGTPTLNKNQYFQLIKQIREAEKEVRYGKRIRRGTSDG